MGTPHHHEGLFSSEFTRHAPPDPSGDPRALSPEASAGILALTVIIALVMMRVSRQDLSGAGPEPTADV
jgi:hypothetical protein